MKQAFKILLVDDDEDDCFITSQVIDELAPCVTVDCIYGGEDLLQRLVGSEPGGFPNLIILDLNMPGLSGFDTLEKLKQHKELKSIPVVIYTTSADVKDAVRCYELGARLVLTKASSVQAMRHQFFQYKDTVLH